MSHVHTYRVSAVKTLKATKPVWLFGGRATFFVFPKFFVLLPKLWFNIVGLILYLMNGHNIFIRQRFHCYLLLSLFILGQLYICVSWDFVTSPTAPYWATFLSCIPFRFGDLQQATFVSWQFQTWKKCCGTTLGLVMTHLFHNFVVRCLLGFRFPWYLAINFYFFLLSRVLLFITDVLAEILLAISTVY